MVVGAGTGVGPCCENCGIDTEPYVRPGAAPLCDRCRRRHALLASAHLVFSWAALAVIVWYGMPRLIAAQVGPGQVLQPGTIYLAFYAALLAGVCLHEGAHALCARVFHFTVPSVRIGSGPLLLRGRIGGTSVTLHLIPFSGLTSWHPGLSEVTTTRRALIAACGPIANLCLAAIAWSLRTHHPDLAVPAACANLLLFIQNILPRPPANANRTPNDGWQIFKNLSGSHSAKTHLRRLELTARCGAFTGAESHEQAVAYLRAEIALGDGDDPDAEAMLCRYLLEPGGSPEAIKEGFERSSRLLRDRRAAPRTRASALEKRAYMLAVGGWPQLMEEAEWTARESLRFLPGNPNAIGTLGLVLLRLGRLEEAEPIINTAIERHLRTSANADATMSVSVSRSLATTRCALGLLYAQTARHDAATHELAHAHALDSTCPLLPELERALTPIAALEH